MVPYTHIVNNLFLQKERFITVFSWVFVLIWMIVIFSLSSQPAKTSDNLSKSVTKKVIVTGERIGMVESGTSQNTSKLSVFNNKIRKYAHAAVFFVLGLLTMNAFRTSRLIGVKAFTYSFALCALYAISDEIHQIFVPGRGAQITDVLVDCAGALLGLGLYSFVVWGIRREKAKRVNLK